jgi:hypothetical protein
MHYPFWGTFTQEEWMDMRAGELAKYAKLWKDIAEESKMWIGSWKQWMESRSSSDTGFGDSATS